MVLSSAGVRWEPEGRNYYRKFGGGTVSAGRSERHLRGRLRAVDSKARDLMPRTSTANRGEAAAAFARQYLSVAFQAYPDHSDIVREAEDKATAFGGGERRFFSGTRLRHVEQLVGWKAARRISTWYRSLLDA